MKSITSLLQQIGPGQIILLLIMAIAFCMIVYVLVRQLITALVQLCKNVFGPKRNGTSSKYGRSL